MIRPLLEKGISLLLILLCCCCQKKDISNDINFINKDFEKKLYSFISKSDSLHFENDNKEFILVYLQSLIIESIPEKTECSIVFYATPPFACSNYKFGTIIKGKKVLFYDNSDCIDFDELIETNSNFECSQFFQGEDYEIDSAIELYYKYENGKLLMRE